MLTQEKKLAVQRDPLDLMSAVEICECLSIAQRTLQTWRQLGQFPPPDLKQGKTLRWRRATIEDWLENQRGSRDFS